MVLSLPPQLEAALDDRAKRQGILPAELAVNILRQHLRPVPTAVDEWEQGLLAAARDCGVSLPNEALTSDGLYD